MKRLCQVYQKSHCEMPDADFEAIVENNKCVMTYAEDENDYIGHSCAGKIIWDKDGGTCPNCHASYLPF